MFYKNIRSCAVLTFSFLFLAGCAQTFETLNSIGEETPPNAPPGYHSFVKAQKAEKLNNKKSAAVNYCTAADLGHPEAKSKCLKFAYLASVEDPTYICQAMNIDKKANRLCTLAGQKHTRAKALEEIKATVERMEAPKKKAIERKKMEKRINSGEFPEFKVEEF